MAVRMRTERNAATTDNQRSPLNLIAPTAFKHSSHYAAHEEEEAADKAREEEAADKAREEEAAKAREASAIAQL
jgi:hypothetical protein